MEFTLDFVLELHITNLKIEASSKEEAIEKLQYMKAIEIVENGSVKDGEVSNIDVE